VRSRLHVRSLMDSNLDIRAGQSLAIVGANGAGKTTALKLLLRLYEPAAGEIRARTARTSNASAATRAA
jgi:ATP-binding cassette subfamily B protein